MATAIPVHQQKINPPPAPQINMDAFLKPDCIATTLFQHDIPYRITWVGATEMRVRLPTGVEPLVMSRFFIAVNPGANYKAELANYMHGKRGNTGPKHINCRSSATNVLPDDDTKGVVKDSLAAASKRILRNMDIDHIDAAIEKDEGNDDHMIDSRHIYGTDWAEGCEPDRPMTTDFLHPEKSLEQTEATKDLAEYRYKPDTF